MNAPRPPRTTKSRKVSSMLRGKSTGQLLREWSVWAKAEAMLSGTVFGSVKNQQEFEQTPGSS